ncbi:MAG: methyltransferase domain-containing protein [Flavobacteriales bacterium]
MSAEERPEKDWYESWFDSPYYHILYKDRDEDEAAFFVDQLANRLKARKGDRILDLACGKGRHAVQLHRKGFDVTGVDLSQNSIEQAKAHEAPGLRFDVHDMRHVYDREEKFDKVLNLFSSFGYFRSEGENYRVIKAASEQLNPGGELVIDFMNAQKAVQELVPHEVKTVEGIEFHIDRYVEYGILVKRIAFYDEGKGHEFKEKLRILFDNDLQVMLERAGMKVIDRFGDYALEPFDRRSSERLIIVARKEQDQLAS